MIGKKYLSVENTIQVLSTMKSILGLSRTERDALDVAIGICERYIESRGFTKRIIREYCPHTSKCKTFGYGCDGISYEFCDKPKTKVDDTEGLIRKREYK